MDLLDFDIFDLFEENMPFHDFEDGVSEILTPPRSPSTSSEIPSIAGPSWVRQPFPSLPSQSLMQVPTPFTSSFDFNQPLNAEDLTAIGTAFDLLGDIKIEPEEFDEYPLSANLAANLNLPDLSTLVNDACLSDTLDVKNEMFGDIPVQPSPGGISEGQRCPLHDNQLLVKNGCIECQSNYELFGADPFFAGNLDSVFPKLRHDSSSSSSSSSSEDFDDMRDFELSPTFQSDLENALRNPSECSDAGTDDARGGPSRSQNPFGAHLNIFTPYQALPLSPPSSLSPPTPCPSPPRRLPSFPSAMPRQKPQKPLSAIATKIEYIKNDHDYCDRPEPGPDSGTGQLGESSKINGPPPNGIVEERESLMKEEEIDVVNVNLNENEDFISKHFLSRNNLKTNVNQQKEDPVQPTPSTSTGVKRGRKPGPKGTRKVGRPPKYPKPDPQTAAQPRKGPGRRPTGRAETMDPKKRLVHNMLERQRRVQLKKFYDNLRQRIPGLADKKAAKVQILNFASKYCKMLTAEYVEGMKETYLNALRNQELRYKYSRLIDMDHDMIDWHAMLAPSDKNR